MNLITCIIPSSFLKTSNNNLLSCISSINRAITNDFKATFLVVSDGKARPRVKGINCKILFSKGGFGAKNNIAINYALKNLKTDYFLLINDDAKVSVDFFKHLKKIINKKPDIVCPTVYKANNKFLLDNFGVEYLKSGWALNSKIIDTKTQLFSATVLIVRETFIKKIISKYNYFFNDIFFYYYEDIELSIRLLSLGPVVVKERELVAYHHGQSSVNKILGKLIGEYLNFRNYLLTIFISWPSKIIYKNIFKIIFVHLWLTITRYKLFFPIFYILLGLNLILILPKIIFQRILTARNYPESFDFNKCFAEPFFYTRKKHLPIYNLSEVLYIYLKSLLH